MTTKIFTAIDDQKQSGRAADAAIDLARATSATIIFFMANPAVMPGRGPLVYQYTRDDIGEYFDQARRSARFCGVYDVRCVTKNCIDVTRSILAEAQKELADYIVVGSDQKQGLFASWKNSISRNVADNSPCPTIIVHSQITPKVSALLAAE